MASSALSHPRFMSLFSGVLISHMLPLLLSSASEPLRESAPRKGSSLSVSSRRVSTSPVSFAFLKRSWLSANLVYRESYPDRAVRKATGWESLVFLRKLEVSDALAVRDLTCEARSSGLAEEGSGD